MVKTITIVSLSSGTLGEDFVRHEVLLGLSRLETMGIRVKLSEHAMAGREYIAAHPKERAEDLLAAFRDPETDLILCAIGGEDTYRLLPYLFGNNELKNAVTQKLFLGFSDSTINHLMLHKVGLPTFYGQAFLSDICEIGSEILPYTASYFTELISTGKIREITPSPVWYRGRTDYSESQVGVNLPALENSGFLLLQGTPVFEGLILGGCIDTLFDVFDGGRFSDSPDVFRKYQLFPSLDDWKGRILLLESSEEQMPPEKYRKALLHLKDTGLFGVINGILVGKPMDQIYQEEYHAIIREVVDDPALPILCNLNVGHALPRCIVPFGVPAKVDALAQKITFSF